MRLRVKESPVSVRTTRSSNLVQPAYDHILNLILNQELKPGDRVPEVAIAEDLGVSRTPVRAALRQLEGEGLVHIFPNRHIEVVSFDEAQMENLGITRIALDSMAVRFAVFRGSNEDFQKLRLLADRCVETVAAHDVKEYIRVDSEFHLELTRISQNPILERYQVQLMRQMQVLLSYRYDFAALAPVTHHMILEAVEERDEEKAVRLIVEHLSDFYQLSGKYPFLVGESKTE